MAPKDYRFWAACPQLPGELVRFVADSDRAVRVTHGTFVRHADVASLPGGRKHDALYRVSCPDNWAISFWRSELPSGTRIYFFDWSRIEHVFVRERPDLRREMEILEARE